MVSFEVSGERAPRIWIGEHKVSDKLKGLVEGALGSDALSLLDRDTLPGAAVADYAWKVTASTAEERDKVAGQLITALGQFSVPNYRCGVYYADQWAADESGQWHGDLYFAVSSVGRDEAELQRCAARGVANAFLEAENSPYRLY